jgi:hypothetical protein
MQEYRTPAEVLAKGVNYGIELMHGHRLVVVNRDVQIVDAPALVFYRQFAQRDNRRDDEGVPSCKFFGVGKATNEKAFPYLGHWTLPSSSSRGSFERLGLSSAATHAGI